MTTPSTRVLVVDDEPLARERLRTLLQEEPGFDLVGEASDGITGAESIMALSPDLVFLDVQMPGADGFDVIDAVGPDKMPFVVFVTAYDRYALRAFDVHALDYLLKPFDRERFRQTLVRAQAQLDRNNGGDLERRLTAIVQDLKPAKARTDRFVVKSGGRIFFVRTGEIDWIEAAGNYVRLHVGPTSHLLRETMNAIEGRLDPEKFFRIHRSRIVNTERIKELQPWFNGEYVVVLHNGMQLRLSRSYREKLEERLGKAL
jgi:two-component system, LytTR family, response regulator